jgi:hypothetical protein
VSGLDAENQGRQAQECMPKGTPTPGVLRKERVSY